MKVLRNTLWALGLLVAGAARANPPPFAPPALPPRVRPPRPPPPAPYVPKPQDKVILFEHAGFKGRAVGLSGPALDLRKLDFNDITSSIKIRLGYQATFYEDIDGKGEWFTLNCPSVPIGIKQSDFCEFKNLAEDVATGYLCELRPRGSHGCVPWWNDRISGVGNIKPADESEPQSRIDEGHNG